MIKVLEQAIKKVKKLSKDRQAYAAHVLEEIAGDNGIYRLDAEERADNGEALTEMERGEVASDDEVKTVFSRLLA